MKIFRLFLIIFGILSFVIFTILGLYFLVSPSYPWDFSLIVNLVILFAIIPLILGFIFLNKKAKIFTTILGLIFGIITIILAFSVNYYKIFWKEEINFFEDFKEYRNFYKIINNIPEISDESLFLENNSKQNTKILDKEKCENLDFIKSLADKHLNIFSIWNKKLQKIKEDIESYPKIKIFLEILELEKENNNMMYKNFEEKEEIIKSDKYRENLQKIEENYKNIKNTKISEKEKLILNQNYFDDYAIFVEFMNEINNNYDGKIYCSDDGNNLYRFEIYRIIGTNIILEHILENNQNLDKNILILEKTLQNNKQENLIINIKNEPAYWDLPEQYFISNITSEAIVINFLKNAINLWIQGKKFEKIAKILLENNKSKEVIVAIKQSYFYNTNILTKVLPYKNLQKIQQTKEKNQLFLHWIIYSLKNFDKENNYPETIFEKNFSEEELLDFWGINHDRYHYKNHGNDNKLLFLEKNFVWRFLASNIANFQSLEKRIKSLEYNKYNFFQKIKSQN